MLKKPQGGPDRTWLRIGRSACSPAGRPYYCICTCPPRGTWFLAEPGAGEEGSVGVENSRRGRVSGVRSSSLTKEHLEPCDAKRSGKVFADRTLNLKGEAGQRRGGSSGEGVPKITAKAGALFLSPLSSLSGGRSPQNGACAKPRLTSSHWPAGLRGRCHCKTITHRHKKISLLTNEGGPEKGMRDPKEATPKRSTRSMSSIQSRPLRCYRESPSLTPSGVLDTHTQWPTSVHWSAG